MTSLAALPGKLGTPYLGDSLELLQHTFEFCAQRYPRYGRVFKTRLLGQETAVLLGAEAHKLVLVEQAAKFSSRAGWNIIHPLFGDGLLLSDGAYHDEQRALMTPAFNHTALLRHLERINAIITSRLQTWGDAGTRPFYLEAHQIAFTIAGSLMVGLDAGPNYKHLKQWWDAFAAGGQTLFHWDVPGMFWMTFRRSMNARRKIERLFHALIVAKRQQPTGDVLGMLAQARNDHEEWSFTEKQLIDQAKVLLFAGFDTTMDAMTWLLAELLQQPDLLERVRAEIGAPTASPVIWDDLRPARMPFLDAAIKETLRLHPQLAWIPRGVVADIDYAGYTIPAGAGLLLMPVFTHRMPEYFSEPERFDPTRFLGERDEDKAHPFAWVGFGTGPHNCLGSGIAQMEIKTVLINLLRRYDLTLLPGQDLSTVYQPLSRPKADVLIRYTPRTLIKETLAS